MSTKIEYVDETINPLQDIVKGESGRGYHCTKVSPGCLNCYAETINNRFGNHLPFDDRPTKFDLIGSELDKPIKWKKPRRIFVQSMGDLFHESVKFEDLHRIFGIMRQTPQHTYFLLTKRPLLMADDVGLIVAKEALGTAMGFYSHVWLGVTICNQPEADEKIPILLQIPGFKKWVSCEPLLDFLGLSRHFPHVHGMRNDRFWVVAGAESGSGARPADDNWFRPIRDQCREAGVPFFMKQTTDPIPDDLMVREYPE